MGATFRNANCTPQQCADLWMQYVLSYGSRESFILWRIARATDTHNNMPWLKYLLKEYETCKPQDNAHRNSYLDIEHLFGDYKSLGSMAAGAGFASPADYGNLFVNRVGNKLVLDASLNRAIKGIPPTSKVPCYQRQAYGSVSVMASNPTESSIEIGRDLNGITSLNSYRIYVLLRSLRLAAFAAKRF